MVIITNSNKYFTLLNVTHIQIQNKAYGFFEVHFNSTLSHYKMCNVHEMFSDVYRNKWTDNKQPVLRWGQGGFSGSRSQILIDTLVHSDAAHLYVKFHVHSNLLLMEILLFCRI